MLSSLLLLASALFHTAPSTFFFSPSIALYGLCSSLVTYAHIFFVYPSLKRRGVVLHITIFVQ
ncbi:hypothetical protein BDN70DRAFT_157033 [Pholiota conissans]|uniref:Uncharacterized protein n=1 Tax=Pholiota conissans TaxID=109636 RepID=A0A9P6CR61_9AGAR|nr:hypothetical protein BDN70DRAFT_157033 [Pholiota conissans]